MKQCAKRILVFPLPGNYLNSIVSVPPSFLMPREHRRPFLRLVSAAEEGPGSEGEGRLDSIIKTFRENNLRLMQKIEECDRIRQIQHHLNQKKLSERHLLEPVDLPHEAIHARPFSQFKTERRIERAPKHHSRKENLALDLTKRTPLPRTENGESSECNALEEKNQKLVKISLNRLVPLSMDRLKERMKIL